MTTPPPTERDVREAKELVKNVFVSCCTRDNCPWCKDKVMKLAQALAARTSGAVEVQRGKSDGFDELYFEWFTCGSCGEPYLAPDWVYCPKCGAKNVAAPEDLRVPGGEVEDAKGETV